MQSRWVNDACHHPKLFVCQRGLQSRCTPSFTLYQGYRLNKHDGPAEPLEADDVRDCSRFCASRSWCLAFSHRTYPDSVCFFKNASPHIYTGDWQEQEEYDSYIKNKCSKKRSRNSRKRRKADDNCEDEMVLHKGYNFENLNGSGIPLKTSDLKYCLNRCLYQLRCLAVIYEKEKRLCHFKHEMPGRYPQEWKANVSTDAYLKNQCQTPLRQSCGNDTDCRGGDKACKEGICQCKDDFYSYGHYKQNLTCRPRIKLGQRCLGKDLHKLGECMLHASCRSLPDGCRCDAGYKQVLVACQPSQVICIETHLDCLFVVWVLTSPL